MLKPVNVLSLVFRRYGVYYIFANSVSLSVKLLFRSGLKLLTLVNGRCSSSKDTFIASR